MDNTEAGGDGRKRESLASYVPPEIAGEFGINRDGHPPTVPLPTNEVGVVNKLFYIVRATWMML